MSSCTPHPFNPEIKEDIRFRLAGNFAVTEYDFQKANYVLHTIESVPNYTYSVFPGSSVKRKTKY
jgi:hypothetical protein